MESGIEANMPRPNITPMAPQFAELPPTDDTESTGSQPEKKGGKKKGEKKAPALDL